MGITILIVGFVATSIGMVLGWLAHSIITPDLTEFGNRRFQEGRRQGEKEARECLLDPDAKAILELGRKIEEAK